MKLFPKSGAVVFYTDWFIIFKWADGVSYGPVIFIRPSKRESKGLLHHELVHSRQFWRTFGGHALMYLFSKKYRLKAEVEAYCASLDYNPERIHWFAWVIANKYGINITQEEAKALLTQCKE